MDAKKTADALFDSMRSDFAQMTLLEKTKFLSLLHADPWFSPHLEAVPAVNAIRNKYKETAKRGPKKKPDLGRVIYQEVVIKKRKHIVVAKELKITTKTLQRYLRDYRRKLAAEKSVGGVQKGA